MDGKMSSDSDAWVLDEEKSIQIQAVVREQNCREKNVT